MRRTYCRSGPLPVTWLCHFRSKGPTRVDMVQLLVAHEHNLLPIRATSGQGLFQSRDWRDFRSKDPTRADMAPLPVAHAQNILPDRVRDWCHVWSCDWRHFWSRHFRSRLFPVAPHSTSANMALSVPIYYSHIINYIEINILWLYI
jgi:hypothetical protein